MDREPGTGAEAAGRRLPIPRGVGDWSVANLLMARGRLIRFRDRRSYKASEVAALFVLSLFAGMFLCALCVALDYVLTNVFGLG